MKYKYKYSIYIPLTLVLPPAVLGYLLSYIGIFLGGIFGVYYAATTKHWVTDLTEQDVHDAIRKLSEVGSQGRRIIFNIANRRFMILVKEHGGRNIMGCQYSLADWQNDLNDRNYDDIMNKWGGWMITSRWHMQYYQFIFTQRSSEKNIKNCFGMFKHAVETAGVDVSEVSAKLYYLNEDDFWNIPSRKTQK